MYAWMGFFGCVCLWLYNTLYHRHRAHLFFEWMSVFLCYCIIFDFVCFLFCSFHYIPINLTKRWLHWQMKQARFQLNATFISHHWLISKRDSIPLSERPADRRIWQWEAEAGTSEASKKQDGGGSGRFSHWVGHRHSHCHSAAQSWYVAKAMSTFSPFGSQSSNGLKMCESVCGWNELEVCTVLAYIHISHFDVSLKIIFFLFLWFCDLPDKTYVYKIDLALKTKD